MKREIQGRIYDTAEAEMIASHASNSTHVHRAISLYRLPDGAFFTVEEHEVHGVDGVLLTPLTDTMARDWLEHHGRSELAASLFETSRIALRIEIDRRLLQRIEAAAHTAGLTHEAWVVAALEAALAAASGARPQTVEA